MIQPHAVDFQLQPFGRNPFLHDGSHVGGDFPRDRSRSDAVQAFRFDLEQVEDVVDDGKQMLGGAIDLGQQFDLFWVAGSPPQDIAKPMMALKGVRIS